jgi:hypothetical protein
MKGADESARMRAADESDSNSTASSTRDSGEDADSDNAIAFLRRVAQGGHLSEALGLVGSLDVRDDLLSAHLATTVVMAEWRAEWSKLVRLEEAEARLKRAHVDWLAGARLYLDAREVRGQLGGAGVIVCPPLGSGLEVRDATKVSVTAPTSDGRPRLQLEENGAWAKTRRSWELGGGGPAIKVLRLEKGAVPE